MLSPMPKRSWRFDLWTFFDNYSISRCDSTYSEPTAPAVNKTCIGFRIGLRIGSDRISDRIGLRIGWDRIRLIFSLLVPNYYFWEKAVLITMTQVDRIFFFGATCVSNNKNCFSCITSLKIHYQLENHHFRDFRNRLLWKEAFNKPFSNYLWPLFQSESWCSSFRVKTRPSVRVNWVACLYVLHIPNLGGIESFILKLWIVGRLSLSV